VSDTSGKCKEIIGYVGDVRNLSDNRGTAVDDAVIFKWARHSNGEMFATLFYSSDDVYHVGNKKQALLKINPDIKFKQIDNIKTFIDYIDNGMDRGEHPVRDVTMVKVYSTWEKIEGSRDYIEEARKRHEPEVRQVSRETVNKLGEAMVKGILINVFLSNKEANATKKLTDSDAYQMAKDSYGWDQASKVKDEILNVADIGKSGVEELESKRELLKNGAQSLSKITPTTLLLKALGPLQEGYGAYTIINNINSSNQKIKKQQKVIEQCWKDAKNPNSNHFDDFGRCVTLQKGTLLNFENDLFEAAGYGALSPQNREKIEKAIQKRKAN